MDFSIPKTNFSKNIIPAGGHIAYCYGVADMGTQESFYQGQKSLKRKIKLFFEFPDIKMTIEGEEKPMAKQVEYTFSDKGNFPKMLAARGIDVNDGLQLSSLIGRPAQVTVIHKEREGNKYADIQSIVVPLNSVFGVEYKIYNETILLNMSDTKSIESDLPKIEKYKWIYEKIVASPEYLKYITLKEQF